MDRNEKILYDLAEKGSFNSNIIKTDSLGIQQWSVIGPSLSYPSYTVCAQQTFDGGYILSTSIVDSLNINNNTNIQIIKYDSFGNQQWNMLRHWYHRIPENASDVAQILISHCITYGNSFMVHA